jgi:hypothetical protein
MHHVNQSNDDEDPKPTEQIVGKIDETVTHAKKHQRG